MTQELTKKLAQFQLDGPNAELLKEVGVILIPLLDSITESFYARAMADPATAKLLENQDRTKFALNAQRKHWERLLRAEFNEDYIASVDRIGRTHARIELPLDTYMSSYSMATTDLIAVLIKKLPRRRRKATGTLISVLTRAFALDIERVVDTFFRIQAEEQTSAFMHLNQAITRLSQGDLTHTIPGPGESDYPVRYDEVRCMMNEATSHLRGTINGVSRAMKDLVQVIEDVNGSTNELAHRTASQAASLEETAAAVHELTENVTNSARNTSEANTVASAAAQTAMEGARTVEEAAGAMGRIQKSSEEISRIIGMIDDIAFQTNLLALNAGVEAARAGSAGRGFAVVAEEVRNLAASASDAAQEINKLVSASAKEVSSGVDFIDRAGNSLKAVVESFEKVSELSASIAAASGEQSNALTEVNSAISQMDTVTQQNAAMVEDTTAAATQMRNKAAEVEGDLSTLKTHMSEPGTPAATAAAPTIEVAA